MQVHEVLFHQSMINCRRFVLMDKSLFEKLAATSERIPFALQNHNTEEQRKFEI